MMTAPGIDFTWFYMRMWVIRYVGIKMFQVETPTCRMWENDEKVLNQLGKPTERPTLKWIFQKFRNINEAIIELNGSIHREIINIKDEQSKIIKLFGPGCEK